MDGTLTSSDKFKLITAVNSQLSDIDVVNGQVIVTTDRHEVHVDNGNIRKKLGDVITGTYSEITSNESPLTGKIYFATDTHQLLQATYDNNTVVWDSLGALQTEIVTNNSHRVAIELADNKIYYLTSSNIVSIKLIVSSSLSYCTLCFTAGIGNGSGTTWEVPNNARCIGYDCTGGIFTPVPGREYQIAVDKLNGVLTFYVINTRLDGQEPDGDSQVITNSDASVSLILDQNTIYRLTSSSLSALNITGVVTGFKYATIIFTSMSGDPTTTFGMPQTGYYCKGAACESGEFVPEADMRYNLAIENEGDRIAIYVMEAL